LAVLAPPEYGHIACAGDGSVKSTCNSKGKQKIKKGERNEEV